MSKRGDVGGERVEISWKSDDVIYEGPPRLSSISIRYKSHMLFDHNYASIWWEPKKCILQEPQQGELILERAFLFSNPSSINSYYSISHIRVTSVKQLSLADFSGE